MTTITTTIDPATVHLRPGHVQPIWAGHPWVYAQAIARIEKSAKGNATPAPGDVVRVVDPHGHVLGRGFWSPRRAIPVRIVSRNEGESLDESKWLISRLERAIARRRPLGLPRAGELGTNGYRVLHAEGDGVPGLVVDLYDDVVVLQAGTAGLRRRAAQVLEAIETTLRPRAILDRTSPAIAQQEGFALESWTRGAKIDALSFVERGLAFEIPTELGQKTGFYFDQRDLRARVESLSKGRRVLDAFCYVGPIALSAARGGAASVVALDDSMRALEVGAACAKKNGLSVGFTRGDVRKELPRMAKDGARFDLVVLDPPKLAPTRGDRDAALQYQTRLVQEAAALVEPNGLLVVCSCSTALGSGELARALALGARRADREATVLERLGQGVDHPVPAAFPEGIYLSTLVAELGPVA